MRAGLRLAALALGLALSLALLETGLRLARVGRDQLLLPDPVLGLRFIRGRSGLSQGACYRTRVSINGHGWRDDEVSRARPEGVYRVLVLGDSYTAGLQVGDDETLTSALERRLADEPGLPPVQVLNFGVPDFGTAQEYVALREYGLAFQPSLVLLAFYAQNDVRNNSRALEGEGSGRPFFDVVDGELVARPRGPHAAPAPLRLVLPFASRLRLYPVLRDTIFYGGPPRLRDPRERPGARGWLSRWPERWREQVEVYALGEAPEWREAWRTTEHLLVAIRGLAARAGAGFLLVQLPDPVAVMPDAMREALAGDLRGEVDPDAASRRLAAIARRHGLDRVSLVPGFRARIGASEAAFARHYLDCDGHWTARGHALAARLLAPHVAERAATARDPPAGARGAASGRSRSGGG